MTREEADKKIEDIKFKVICRISEMYDKTGTTTFPQDMAILGHAWSITEGEKLYTKCYIYNRDKSIL